MEFTIQVTGAGSKSRTIAITGPASLSDQRTISIVNRRPLLETNNPPDLEDRLARFETNSLNPGDSAAIGNHLFNVLIGSSWAAIKAGIPIGDPAELEFQFDAADTEMQALPWEMMTSPDGLLATCDSPRVTFARSIAPAKKFPAPQFTAPFRVLIVVGSQLNSTLRPGAELIGLLRRPEFDGSGLAMRILGEADYETFQRTVREFRPSLIHLICHGQIRDGAPPEIRLLHRVADAGGKTKTEEYPLSASRLIELMQQPDGWIPPVVILNACYTGTTFSPTYLSFAASLVDQGVAMAIGMAGEVADRACQAFTLRFYQALTSEEPIAAAAAQGRRATLLKYPELEESIEWTRPTLFIRKGLSAKLTMPQSPNIELARLAPKLRVVGRVPQALCARYSALQCYQDLIGRLAVWEPGAPLPPEPLLLAFMVTDAAGGVGKTRLLEEIGVRAISDLFFPIILRREAVTPPANFLDFAMAISDTMVNEARKNFKLPFDPQYACPDGCSNEALSRFTRVRRLAFKKFGIKPDFSDRDNFREQLGDGRKQAAALNPEMSPEDVSEILDAIRDDFDQLLHDVKAKAGGVTYRAMLLLDDVHQYARVAVNLVESAGPGGIGSDDNPIPLVFTYMTTTSGGASIRQALQRNVSDEQQPELGVFKDAAEQRMAYGQWILSWKRLATNERSKFLKNFLDRLQTKTGGRPSRLIAVETGDFIEDAQSVSDALVEADFDAALKQFP
jgi:hypothetical protein